MCGRRPQPNKNPNQAFLAHSLRDRQETSQVLFVIPSEKGRGRELRPSENTKPFYEI